MFFSRPFFTNIGIVESVGDGIVNILGLQNVANGEMKFKVLRLIVKQKPKKLKTFLFFLITKK